LKSAISVAGEAVNLTPPNHPDLPSRLSNLSNLLFTKYKKTEDKADLEDAIEKARCAVRAIPEELNPDLAGQLSDLSNMLLIRYDSTHDEGSLDEAISLAHEAIRATLDSKPDLPAALNSLEGLVLGGVKRIVTNVWKAVHPGQGDSTNLATRLSRLSSMLLTRYEKTENKKDLDEAISAARHAVRATPDHHRHQDLAGRLHHLGNMLSRRYNITGDMKDREEASNIAVELEDLGDDHDVDSHQQHSPSPARRNKLSFRSLSWVIGKMG
jgi:tetratricopeptide (TPR) repeat protein